MAPKRSDVAYRHARTVPTSPKRRFVVAVLLACFVAGAACTNAPTSPDVSCTVSALCATDVGPDSFEDSLPDASDALRNDTPSPMDVVVDAPIDAPLDTLLDAPPETVSDGDTDVAVLDADPDAPAWSRGTVLPNWSLRDENRASASYARMVSPRDHIGAVTAWYFGHST